jgi:hypothetical protein
LRELEYYELSLLDEANDLGTRHVVKQWHGAWSEIDRQIMWDQEEVEYFRILAQAKERYEERRRALVEKGFIYSDSRGRLNCFIERRRRLVQVS